MNNDILMTLIRVHEWIVAGGEHRAGLPTNALSPLHNSTQNLLSHIYQVNSDLQKLQSHWERITEISSPALVNLYFRQLVVELHNIELRGDTLVKETTESDVFLQEAEKLVHLYIDKETEERNQAEAALGEAKEQRKKAEEELADAKKELEGSSGFWNGFLTGITLSIYNPIQQNINKANAAIAKYNHQTHLISTQIAILNRNSEELRECKILLGTMKHLKEVFVDYLNFITTIKNALSVAHKDAERLGLTHSERLGAFYRERVGKDMGKLFDWINLFCLTS